MQGFQQEYILLVGKQESFLHLVKLILKQLKSHKPLITGTLSKGLMLCNKHNPRVCIIELELDDKQVGLDLAQKIRSNFPETPIVLVTDQYNDSTYAKCLSVRPSSFLNKDISRLMLLQAVELAMLQCSSPTVAPTSFPTSEPHSPKLQNLFVKTGDTFRQINPAEVNYFFAKGKTTFARIGNCNLQTNVQIKKLEEELNPIFWRIHKTYLINTRTIETVNIRDNFVEIGDERLPIGHVYRKAFLENIKLLK